MIIFLMERELSVAIRCLIVITQNSLRISHMIQILSVHLHKEIRKPLSTYANDLNSNIDFLVRVAQSLLL